CPDGAVPPACPSVAWRWPSSCASRTAWDSCHPYEPPTAALRLLGWTSALGRSTVAGLGGLARHFARGGFPGAGGLGAGTRVHWTTEALLTELGDRPLHSRCSNSVQGQMPRASALRPDASTVAPISRSRDFRG